MAKRKGIVEKALLGTPKEKDFTSADLPANRVKLLGYLLRNRLRVLYCNHLLTALFFLPLIAWAILSMNYLNEVFTQGDTLQQMSNLPYATAVVYGTAIPLWIVAFVGMAGGMYVTRRYCWGLPVNLRAHFSQGLKQSAKQFSLLGLVFGAAYALVMFCLRWLSLYAQLNGADMLTAMGAACLAVLSLVFCGVTMFALCMSSLYNVSFGRLYINSFKLFFKTFWLSAALLIAGLLPSLALFCVPLVFTQLVGYCLVFVVQPGWAMLLWTLCCHSAFDKYVNAKDYPDYYGKGLKYGKREPVVPPQQTEQPQAEQPSAGHASADEVETDFEKPSEEEQ